jgi:hypothetical protein
VKKQSFKSIIIIGNCAGIMAGEGRPGAVQRACPSLNYTAICSEWNRVHSPASVGASVGARVANNDRNSGCAGQQWCSLFSEECI